MALISRRLVELAAIAMEPEATEAPVEVAAECTLPLVAKAEMAPMEVAVVAMLPEVEIPAQMAATAATAAQMAAEAVVVMALP